MPLAVGVGLRHPGRYRFRCVCLRPCAVPRGAVLSPACPSRCPCPVPGGAGTAPRACPAFLTSWFRPDGPIRRSLTTPMRCWGDLAVRSLLLAQPPADPAREPSPPAPVPAGRLSAAHRRGNRVLPRSAHPRRPLLGETSGLGGCRGKQQTGCSRSGVSGFGLAATSGIFTGGSVRPGLLRAQTPLCGDGYSCLHTRAFWSGGAFIRVPVSSDKRH